jgi:signal transduction histidine kinase
MATATTQTTSNVDSLNISAKQISQSTYRVSDSDNSTKSSNLVERSFERSRYNDGIDRFLSTFILDEVIADAVLAISKFAIPREVQVAFEPTDEAIVCADRDMIFAMVHNLISNAVKFSHRLTVR